MSLTHSREPEGVIRGRAEILARCAAFMRLLDLRYPIAQAPVGSAGGPTLAAAVAASGGLGALAATWMPPEEAARAVRDIRTRTSGAFQVNFVLTHQPTGLDVVLEAGAPVVTFSWGRATGYVARAHTAGALVGVQVASVDGARRALDRGVDFLICQGVEAGGHVQASRPLVDVLHEVFAGIVLESAGVPVLAAGGIGDGPTMAAALHGGAHGAVLGTRFVATRESDAHPDYKQALVDASGAESVLTVCFEGDWPYAAHRVLRNATMRAWEDAGSPPKGQRPGEGDVVAARSDGRRVLRYDDDAPLRTMTGNVLDMALYAGVSCGPVRDIPSVAELVPRLWSDCLALLSE